MGPAASKANGSPTAPAAAAADGSGPAKDEPKSPVWSSAAPATAAADGSRPAKDVSPVWSTAIAAMHREYDKYTARLQERAPRILLVGDAGAGKSSLVNLVFGLKPADGATVRAGGRPCTQNFAEWGPFPLAPVRVIDSKGIEKRGDQVEHVSKYIEDSFLKDAMEHVHAVWYFVGDRWQDGDKEHVQKLQEMCGVVVVMNKADKRKPEEVENTRKAIQEDLPSIELVLCGDPRGTMNWIKQECVAGHPRKEFIIDMERNRWICQKETGCDDQGNKGRCSDSGDDQPYGYVDLVNLTVDHLPKMCKESFLAAQRVDLSRKHRLAAAATATASVAAAVVGAAPIPFADYPILTAIEAGLYGTILAIYNLPVADGASAAFAVGLGAGCVGLTGLGACSIIKCVPGIGQIVMGVSAAVAASTVASFGAAVSVMCSETMKKLAEVAAEGQRYLSEEEIEEIAKDAGWKVVGRKHALEMTAKENLDESLFKEIEVGPKDALEKTAKENLEETLFKEIEELGGQRE